MKLVVVVPSKEYLGWAGARIRYHRIRRDLAAAGVDMSLQDLATFNPMKSDCDAVCISKCHDPKSLIIAAVMSERGKFVGIDLFDDYFSDTTDSRLVRYRSWLRAIVGMCNFALCSTPAMADVIGRYRRDLPTHVLNDPAPGVDAVRMAALVQAKQEAARLSNRLKVVWFGIGDNAFFPVGLSDLSAFSAVLSDLSSSGHDVELTILTNSRALGAEGLSLISRLPVQTKLAEWSEEAEQRVLEDALLAFLPVNAQGFSAAKSLNRGITALSSGCQVLSVGYPLYEALSSLIYRDPHTFLRDLADGSLRLSGAGLAAYIERMNALASAPVEAQRLADFLLVLDRGDTAPSGPINLIHGHSTRADAHSLVQEVGGFSVASPFCSAALEFDVIFRAIPFGLEMLVSRSAARRLAPGSTTQLHAGRAIGGRDYKLVRHGPAAPNDGGDAPETGMRAVPVQLATYEWTMRRVHALMSETFGPVRTIVSETSRLPFRW